MDLDDFDWQLLTLLQKDCRISNAGLAEAAGLSASSCWRRVRALEEAGLVQRYAAVLDPARVGMGFQAMVHVQLTRHDPEKLAEFIRVIETRPEVVECYATTGQADYHLRVIVSDLEAYNRFLEEVLFRLPAVASAQTNVILRSVKSYTGISRRE
ncbi:Lrp/AsnC family transcriptional regulator [Aliiroseovarius lamellibrachiae]|uniref:Lrp/AsnC family transcriptional regulator n=1 Tax=Aliiroseovarius lamellibrachiae TaxID=1924933 RepID=UPI001BE108C6|nr:Lrp/AsnC family transcriptional regulator [Aliiroseovarius lamellibrachiae]MBT2132446.1 Lrp/AsnC family transcriptional regulator [Aliiroseovarius lamellibrachiae]